MEEKKYKRKRKSKSKKKWWLSALLVVVLLVVIGGGYALYEFKFKTYDVADEKVDEIVEEDYVIQLPDGTEISIDDEGNIVEKSSGQLVLNTIGSSTSTDSNLTQLGQSQQKGQSEQSGQSAQTSQTGQTGQTSQSNETQGNPSNSTVNNSGTTQPNSSTTPTSQVAEKPTVKSIKAKYTPTLQALQSQANGRINGLVSNAKAEYSQKKANGESISIGYFYNKYMGAANSLEASTDAAFNSLMTLIENDFVSNGYDKSHAQSFRNDYEAMKEERRNSLLSQVKGAL